MALIVDASISGKLNFKLFHNVVSESNAPELQEVANGLIKVTNENVDKINARRGIPRSPLGIGGIKSASEIVRQQSDEIIPSLAETSKGVYLETVA